MSVLQVNGKSFIITGAASGIGRQLAKGLAQNGAQPLTVEDVERAFYGVLRKIWPAGKPGLAGENGECLSRSGSKN